MKIRQRHRRGPPHGWHIDEAKHRRTERIYWLATLGLTVILAIGATISALYTLQAAQTAQRTLLATTRAWLAIEKPEELLSLEWRDSEIIISVGVGAVNKGPSPALSVSLSASVDEPKKIVSDDTSVQRYCAAGSQLAGSAIFPNQTGRASIATPFTVRLSPPQREPLPPSLIQGLSGHPYEVLEMAICVTYKILGDTEQHHTLEYFYLGKVRSDVAKGRYPDAIVYGENLSGGKLVAEPDDGKGFAD